MKASKWSRRERILICVGILLTTSPILLKDVVGMPDFVRGFLAGLGITLEMAGIVRLNRKRRSEAACR